MKINTIKSVSCANNGSNWYTHENMATWLHDSGANVSIANPAHVKYYAQSLGGRTKNDKNAVWRKRTSHALASCTTGDEKSLTDALGCR